MIRKNSHVNSADLPIESTTHVDTSSSQESILLSQEAANSKIAEMMSQSNDAHTSVVDSEDTAEASVPDSERFSVLHTEIYEIIRGTPCEAKSIHCLDAILSMEQTLASLRDMDKSQDNQPIRVILKESLASIEHFASSMVDITIDDIMNKTRLQDISDSIESLLLTLSVLLSLLHPVNEIAHGNTKARYEEQEKIGDLEPYSIGILKAAVLTQQTITTLTRTESSTVESFIEMYKHLMRQSKADLKDGIEGNMKPAKRRPLLATTPSLTPDTCKFERNVEYFPMDHLVLTAIPNAELSKDVLDMLSTIYFQNYVLDEYRELPTQLEANLQHMHPNGTTFIMKFVADPKAYKMALAQPQNGDTCSYSAMQSVIFEQDIVPLGFFSTTVIDENTSYIGKVNIRSFAQSFGLIKPMIYQGAMMEKQSRPNLKNYIGDTVIPREDLEMAGLKLPPRKGPYTPDSLRGYALSLLVRDSSVKKASEAALKNLQSIPKGEERIAPIELFLPKKSGKNRKATGLWFNGFDAKLLETTPVNYKDFDSIPEITFYRFSMDLTQAS